jgi:outer membrane protein assembly factor BamB
VFSAPTIAGGRVFFGGQDQYLYAVDLLAGGVVWKERLDGEVNASPAVDGDTVVVPAEVSGGGRAKLYALDARSGDVRWSFSQLGGTGVSSATLDRGLAFIGFPDHTVRAFDVRTGAERWSRPVRGGFGPVLGSAVSDGALFVPDADGAVYRFDARTGHLDWLFQFPDVSFGASPLVAGRFVYMGSADGTIGAVDAATGRLVWSTRFADPARDLIPDGDLLLAPFVNGQGGMAALRHDPKGVLVAVDSPTTLHLPVALAGFGVAFVVLTLAILTAFRLMSARHASDSDGLAVDLSASPGEDPEDDER